MTLWQTIRCDGCGEDDCLLEHNQNPIRHEFRNWWLVGVKNKWTGELLDFCPDCKDIAIKEHLANINDN